eukprot:Tamp_33531.p2 GENE.Tamp_33531~~Tamp_33531.p2  ORF type:complete len:161 (+),score=18.89 Tamp_33531:31-483(+)
MAPCGHEPHSEGAGAWSKPDSGGGSGGVSSSSSLYCNPPPLVSTPQMPGTSAACPPYSGHPSYPAAHTSSLQHIHPAIPAVPYAGLSHHAHVRAPRAGELHVRDGLAHGGPVGRRLDDEQGQVPEMDGYHVRSHSTEMDGVYAGRGCGRW